MIFNCKIMFYCYIYGSYNCLCNPLATGPLAPPSPTSIWRLNVGPYGSPGGSALFVAEVALTLPLRCVDAIRTSIKSKIPENVRMCQQKNAISTSLVLKQRGRRIPCWVGLCMYDLFCASYLLCHSALPFQHRSYNTIIIATASQNRIQCPRSYETLSGAPNESYLKQSEIIDN